LNLDFLKRIRRNHALEHATIGIAHSHMASPGAMAGNSTAWGFFIYGDVPTQVVFQAADEALERLKAGEGELAISPFCGTNLVVAAALTGLACAWALGNERRWRKIPRAINAAMTALLVARAVGHHVQRHITTSGVVGSMRIKGINRVGVGGLTVHSVRTSWEE
jgi:hypothetical protein